MEFFLTNKLLLLNIGSGELGLLAGILAGYLPQKKYPVPYDLFVFFVLSLVVGYACAMTTYLPFPVPAPVLFAIGFVAQSLLPFFKDKAMSVVPGLINWYIRQNATKLGIPTTPALETPKEGADITKKEETQHD
jgi:hypothetical protein